VTVLSNLLASNAIHWARSGTDTMAVPSFSTPASITCQWEARTQVVLTANNERVESGAVAYVSTDVAQGDWLKLGTLATSTASDPRDESGAREVVAFEKRTAPLIAAGPVRKAYLR